MAFFTIITVVTVFVFGLQCIPLRAVWDLKVRGNCIPTKVLFRIIQAQGSMLFSKVSRISPADGRIVLSVIMDVCCVLLPGLVLRRLQVGWKQKLGLMVALGLGLL